MASVTVQITIVGDDPEMFNPDDPTGLTEEAYFQIHAAVREFSNSIEITCLEQYEDVEEKVT